MADVEAPGSLFVRPGGGREEAEPLPEPVVVERDVVDTGRLPADTGAPPVDRVGAVVGRLVSDGGFSLEGETPLAAHKRKAIEIISKQGRKCQKQHQSINTSDSSTSRGLGKCSIC